MERDRPYWLYCGLLLAVGGLVFSPSLFSGFVNWDDGRLIANSGWRGISLSSLSWWFTSFVGGDYKPLTWASYGFDYSFWGLNPFGYHLGNVLLHLLNSLLLFFLLIFLGACPSNDLWRAACHLQANQGARPKSYPLRYFEAAATPSRAASGGCPKGFGGGRPSAALRTPRRSVKLRLRRRALHPATRRSKRVESHYSERLLGGGRGRAAAVIGVLFFSLHPLRVESVSWITERKDVLSVFFYLLSVLSYLRYQESSSPVRWYALSLIAALLACLAKPVAVSLPFILLLLDFYLGRNPVRALREKIPFFIPAALIAGAALSGQMKSTVLVPLSRVGLLQRFLLAGRSSVFYLIKNIFPNRLRPLYEVDIPPLSPAPADLFPLLIVLGTTALLIFLRRRGLRRALFLWFAYLITLFPVSGLFPAGRTVLADRFSYLPSTVLALAVYCVLSRLRKKTFRRVLTPSVAGLLLLAFLTVKQERIWKDSVSLWDRTVLLEPASHTAHNNLGVALAGRGEIEEAVARYREALGLKPAYPEAQNNLGGLLARQGKFEEAVIHYSEALRLKPDYRNACYGLALALEKSGRTSESIAYYKRCLRLDPDYEPVRRRLGMLLEEKVKAINHK